MSDAACAERVMSDIHGHRRYVIAAVRALVVGSGFATRLGL